MPLLPQVFSRIIYKPVKKMTLSLHLLFKGETTLTICWEKKQTWEEFGSKL